MNPVPKITESDFIVTVSPDSWGINFRPYLLYRDVGVINRAIKMLFSELMFFILELSSTNYIVYFFHKTRRIFKKIFKGLVNRYVLKKPC